MTPAIFKRWAAIVTIGGALERRVFTFTDVGIVYPNLFVMLVAPPGIGKTLLLEYVRSLWMGTKELKVAPSNMTKAALVDVLQRAKKIHNLSGGRLLEYHSLQVVAEEFGVFCPAHDQDFLSTLSSLYNCGDNYSEERRSRKAEDQIDVTNPQLSLIAGAQPDYLAELLPAVAWGQGFMARVIMVYSDTLMRVPLFSGRERIDPKATDAYKHLAAKLHSIVKRVGYVKWEPAAEKLMEAWYLAGCPTEPDHFKLKHYNTRRHFHVLKLALISAASREAETIAPFDVTRAIEWLTSAEAFMPEVFKAMTGKSDGDVIREFQIFVNQRYAQTQKNIHAQTLITYLQNKTPAYNVMRVIELAEKSEMIVKIAGTNTYRPGGGQPDMSKVN